MTPGGQDGDLDNACDLRKLAYGLQGSVLGCAQMDWNTVQRRAQMDWKHKIGKMDWKCLRSAQMDWKHDFRTRSDGLEAISYAALK